MTTLRAFPFSLNILWQYIIVFPILVFGLLGLTWLTIIASYDVLVLFVQPTRDDFRIWMGIYVIGFMCVMLLAAIYTFPMLVGLRLGLTTRGHKPAGSYWSLILPAAGYGMLVGLGTAIIVLAGAIWYLQSISLSILDIVVLLENATIGYILRNVFTNMALIAQVTMYCWFVFTAFYTALLVPLASVAIGRDPSGNSHTPFAGFGAGFIPLLALVIIVYLLSAYSVQILQVMANVVGLGDRVAGILLIMEFMEDGKIPFEMTRDISVIWFIGLCFWLWTLSLLSAGATLVYLDRFERHKLERAEKLKVERLEPEQVRALWQRRMPGQSD